jgi:MFS transporter, ACDE family, multidrug resistance protein
LDSDSRFLFASVTLSRVIYALAWYDLAAAFPAMASALHYNFQDLGLLTSAFLIGAGVFQVPAGIYSAHRGASKAALIGLAVIGTSSLATVLTNGFELQIVVRFVTGVGAAFYFAPALVIVSHSLGQKRSGFTIGIYNSAFNLGAGIGILFFTPIAAIIDWRLPFIITGVLTLIALAENVYALRGWVDPVKVEMSKIKSTLASKDILIVIAATIGMDACYYVVSQFLPSYSEKNLHFSPFFAGLVSSLILLSAVIGAPTWGLVADRLRNRRLVILLTTIGGSVSIALFALENPSLSWICAFLSGFFFTGALTNCYAFPVQLPEIGRKYAPLSIGLINAISILGGAFATTLFPSLALNWGYFFSWILFAAVSVAVIPLIYAAREPYRVAPLEEEEKSATTPEVSGKPSG